MRALVLYSDLSLKLTEQNYPAIQQDEILVKTMVVGLCGSDKRLLSYGSPRLKFPAVMGHEFAGVIAEVGNSVNGWERGDRVVFNSAIPCGYCQACIKKRENLCKSQIVFGYQIHGGLAEYVKVPSRAIGMGVIQRLPDDLGFDLAALAEPVAAMVNAFDMIRPERQSSLAIIGGSSTAISAAILATSYGCSEVTIFASRRKFGRISELDIPNVSVICMSEDYSVKADKDFDAVVVCADSLKAQELGLKLLAPRGKIHFFGVVPKNEGGLDLNSNDIHYMEQTITGSFGASSSHLVTAIDLINQYRNLFRSSITAQYDLENYQNAFADLQNGDGLKIQINF